MASYERAIALKPDYADAYYNRGVALAELDRPREALESYERAIALKPEYAEAHNNRGIVLDHLKRHDGGGGELRARHCAQARLRERLQQSRHRAGSIWSVMRRRWRATSVPLRSSPTTPKPTTIAASCWLTSSATPRRWRAIDRAIALKPDYAEAYYNRGNALRELHRHAEAMDSFERAIALKPDHASAHWNLADCRLLLGDFALGWQEYEWRWKLDQREKRRRDFRSRCGWAGSRWRVARYCCTASWAWAIRCCSAATRERSPRWARRSCWKCSRHCCHCLPTWKALPRYSPEALRCPHSITTAR